MTAARSSNNSVPSADAAFAGAAVLPGAAIGILGAGQLGRMLALAARRMGYRVVTFSDVSNEPAAQLADREFVGDYDDDVLVLDFADVCDVVTFEFENIPLLAGKRAEKRTRVRPRPELVHTAQHRRREKEALAAAGFATAPFKTVSDPRDLEAAVEQLGLPIVLKTAAFGYDGKGQRMIHAAADADAAYEELGSGFCVAEGFVDFECELSCVVARGEDGATAVYPPSLNEHADHILDVCLSPAPVAEAVHAEAREIAARVAEALQLVGVLCVEFFLTKEGTLLINEIAPRPHNSGHLTIEAAAVCQFEQQLRAVCGLPLGSTELVSPAAMANLLGDLWKDGEPNWAAALAIEGVSLHLYGKSEPRPGRKMGHLTALAETAAEAGEKVRRARAALRT